jgi:hypothetical protein
MATKRMTDAEKWKDPFFEELTNDYKLIWLFLLDDCDNAGVWHKSIKRLNYNCNTNEIESTILTVLRDRVFQISADKWFIPKFLPFQYGIDWINSKNKAVVSAKTKLETVGILKDNELVYKNIQYSYPIDTLSIPYEYPMDRAKDKVKDKVKVKVKDKEQDKDTIKVYNKYEAIIKNKNTTPADFDDLLN